MELFRFATLRTPSKSKHWQDFSIVWEGIEVRTIAAGKSDDGPVSIIAARLPLEPAEPQIDDGGLVVVPAERRTMGERAIETAAEHVSTFTGVHHEIWSPRLSVAFHAGSPGEPKTLRDSGGIENEDRFFVRDAFTVDLDPELIREMDDREDGVTIISESLAAKTPAGQYRELLRLFERAFGTTSNDLVRLLSDFLAARKALEYSKSEVKRWLIRMRGPAIHADRSGDVLTEGDFRPIVHRMLFAAYDVLLNKRDWQGRTVDRRAVWEPTHGPHPKHGVVAVQGQAGKAAVVWLDSFQAFRMKANAANFELDDTFWPRTGPSQMRSLPQPMQVVPQADFSPDSSS